MPDSHSPTRSPSLAEVLEDFDSKFRFVLIASQRAEQLVRGARPKLDVPGKAARVAMEEVKRDLLPWEYGPEPEPEIDEDEAEEAAGEGVSDESDEEAN